MQGLQSAAERIGDVVRLISEIAGQTNLLALNATIEAARAGDAGKGFAVVASEVKQLAAQTARATEEIAAQVQGIRDVTEQTAVAVRQMGVSIGQVDAVAAAIAAAVEQQSAATREIATSVLGVMDTTRTITGAMRDAALLAGGSLEKGRVVQGAAGEVNRVASTLSGEVDNFLSAMKGDEKDRRQYERIPGMGMPASLRRAGASKDRPIALTVDDLSRGGIVMKGEVVDIQSGAEVEVLVAGQVISGRIARAGKTGVAVAFQQNAATLILLDRLLAAVQARETRQPAA